MNNFSIGNDLMVKWAICNPDGSPFPVATYAYELCYSVGRNVNVVKDTAALYTERNEIIWRFAGIEQNFKGSYSLTLRLYENGKCVFTLSKRDAFTLDNFKSHTPCVLNLVSYCESNTLQQVQIIATHAMDVSLDAKENSIEAVETANEAKTLSSEAVEVSGQAKDTADAASVDAGEAIRRVRTAEGQIAGIALDLGDLSTRVDNVENEVESQGGRVNAVEQSIDTLSSEIDSLDLDYTSLDVRVGGAETDIAQTKQKVGNLSQLVTPTKSNLVSAINEAYNHGGGGSSVNVVDGLDSDSSTDALSAKQGKALKGMLDGKVDKEAGKGLSANDYTDIDRAIVESLDDGNGFIPTEHLGLPIINHGIGDKGSFGSPYVVPPLKYHIWGAVDELYLDFGVVPAGYVQPYYIQFTCPSNAATILHLPSGDKIYGGELEPGLTYRISIVGDFGTIEGWEE